MPHHNSTQEEDLALFAEITQRYFERTMGEFVRLDRATLSFTRPLFDGFTGLIQMSGEQQGYVYLSMGEPLLRQLLNRLGEPQQDAAMCRDFVGEIASTIASNAREHFGSKLGISTPIAMNSDEARSINWPFSHLTLPFTVLGHNSQLVIALEGH